MTPRCTPFARCSLFPCYDVFPLFRTRLTLPCLRSLTSRRNHFDDLSETWKNNSFFFFFFFLSFIFYSFSLFFFFCFCSTSRRLITPIYLCNSCGTRANSVSFDEACPAESRPVRLITWIWSHRNVAMKTKTSVLRKVPRTDLIVPRNAAPTTNSRIIDLDKSNENDK